MVRILKKCLSDDIRDIYLQGRQTYVPCIPFLGDEENQIAVEMGKKGETCLRFCMFAAARRRGLVSFTNIHGGSHNITRNSITFAPCLAQKSVIALCL